MIHRNIFLGLIVLLNGILLGACADQEKTSANGSKSVLDFGARGDSVTDDTEAIQEAVDSGIGQIAFPSGTYRVTQPIEIDLDRVGPVGLSGQGTARIIMDGAGPAFEFIGTHDGTANPATVNPNVWESQRMPLVDGLEIVGQHPEAVGIQATGTMQLTINRVLVRKALHGIHLTERNRNVIISDVHIYENQGVGIYLDEVNLHQINITNSHISYNGGGGIVVRKGEVRNLQIGSCDIEGNMDENGPPTANIFIDITEGTMREGAVIGSTIQHTADAPESANIRFVGHGTEVRRKTGNFTIADNVLSDAQYNIDVQYGRGLVITGNTFWKGTAHNIRILESDHINLGNNMLDRNPDYRDTESRNNIVIRESSNLTITGMHLNHAMDGPAGIVLDQCRNYNLTNSTILNCEESGILLRNSENGKVSGNLIRDAREGVTNPVAIRIQGGSNNLITTNQTNGTMEGDPGSSQIINNY